MLGPIEETGKIQWKDVLSGSYILRVLPEHELPTAVIGTQTVDRVARDLMVSLSESFGLWRTFGERELKRTEKRQALPLGAGTVIRRPRKVPKITNRIAAPVEIEQYHQMCARAQIIRKTTA